MAARPITARRTRGTRPPLLRCLVIGVAVVAPLPACDHSHATQGDKTTEQAPRPQPKDQEKPKPRPDTDGKTTEGSPKDGKTAESKNNVVYETVTIAGRKFKLELAADDVKRFRGLSGRTEIPEDGGMLFVFPRAARQAFVMRDCPVPIDIIYLDGAGRVVAMYKMTPEPRLEDEKENDIPPPNGSPAEWGTNRKYENRLTRYPSRFDSQFIIELKGNTLDTLKIKPGDKVEIDVVRLKKLAK